MRSKYHFIIIGSGWRALYYVRVAKALPEIFCIDAMYCGTREKADLIAGQYQIHTTTSIEECVAYKPDFAVVAVKKDAICDVSMEWLDRGITVLSETPAALDMDSLNKLYSYYKCGKKQVVAEQYREYPNIKASLKLINEGIIGDVSCVNVSLAHEYHGISLIRAFLELIRERSIQFQLRHMSFLQHRPLQDMISSLMAGLRERKDASPHLNLKAGKWHGMILIRSSTGHQSERIRLKFRV